MDAAVKRALLGLLGQATAAGWSFQKACRVLGVGERRARYWQARQAAGLLEDRRPGGTAVHALRPEEIEAILRPVLSEASERMERWSSLSKA